ncbi:MAG: hypothetical protein JWP97_2064 [Labilithrix sp.]|nr:hypothetical protein [Labilithrix sp.]
MSSRRGPLVAALLVPVALFVLVDGLLATSRAVFPLVSSDEIFPYAFALGPTRSWSITPAPSYADLGVTLMLVKLLGSLDPVQEAYALLFALLLLGASYRVARALGLHRLDALLATLSAGAALYGSVRATNATHRALSYPAMHGTTLLVVVLGIGTLVPRLGRSNARRRAPRSTSSTAVAGAALGVLGCGDSLVLAQLIAPCLVLLLLVVTTWRAPRRLGRDLAGFVGSFLAGFVIAGTVLRAVGPVVPTRPFVFAGDSILRGLASLGTFMTGGSLAQETSAGGRVLLLLALLALLLGATRAWGRPAAPAATTTTLLVALVIVCTLLAPVLAGEVADYLKVRYVLPALVLPLLLFPVPLVALNRRASVRLVACAALLLVGGGSGLALPPRAPREYAPGGPSAAVTALVQQVVDDGVRVGFAGYWEAKPLAVEVGQGVRISTLQPGGSNVRWWISDGAWIFEHDPAREAWRLPQRFFVVEKALPPGSAEAVFGPAEEKRPINGGNVLVFRTDEARYQVMADAHCRVMAAADRPCPPFRRSEAR